MVLNAVSYYYAAYFTSSLSPQPLHVCAGKVEFKHVDVTALVQFAIVLFRTTVVYISLGMRQTSTSAIAN